MPETSSARLPKRPQAFSQGTEKSDYIVMARARTLQCIVENTAVEEQVGDRAVHHEAAEIFAREAVNFAGRTQNRRLLARAYIWLGLTFSAGPAARFRRCAPGRGRSHCAAPARSLGELLPWDDLETLKTRVLRARPVDSVLRAWSAGIVENKTFQQMEEEFARIVIPRSGSAKDARSRVVRGQLSIFTQEGAAHPAFRERGGACRRRKAQSQPKTRVRRIILSRSPGHPSRVNFRFDSGRGAYRQPAVAPRLFVRL